MMTRKLPNEIILVLIIQAPLQGIQRDHWKGVKLFKPAKWLGQRK